MSKYFEVIERDTGVLYFAEITRVEHHSDDGYSHLTMPSEYRVVAAENKGLVREPVEGVVGALMNTSEFWNRYSTPEEYLRMAEKGEV